MTVRIHRTPRVHVREAPLERLVTSAFFVVEAVATGEENLVHGEQLDLFAVRQVRRFVEDETAFAHVGPKRLYRAASVAPRARAGHRTPQGPSARE
jgi:hypothetical protein